MQSHPRVLMSMARKYQLTDDRNLETINEMFKFQWNVRKLIARAEIMQSKNANIELGIILCIPFIACFFNVIAFDWMKKKWNQKYWAQMISDCPLVDWIKTKHQKERTNYVTKVCGTHTKKGRKKQTNKQRNSSPLQLLSSISSVYPSSPLHKHTCGWFWFRLAPNADLVLFVSTAHSIPSSQSPVLLHTWRNSRK